MTGTLHPLAQEYLARLDRASAALPPQMRAELLADLQAHLETGVTADLSDAEVRNLLQELGSPEDIVESALVGGDGTDGAVTPTAPLAPMTPTAPLAGPVRGPWGALEIAAVVLLTVGMFVVPIVGPLLGLVLAWISDRWSRKEKVVATILTLSGFVAVVLGLLAVVVV